MNLHKKALVLSYITVGYNVLEGIISIVAGFISGSIALIGFGLDSFVECLSGSVMIWRFRKHDNMAKEEEERVEKKAIQLVSYTFFILGAYVLYESIKNLLLHEVPEKSLVGIIIAILSFVIMPLLFYLKHQTGKKLNSRSLVADSKQTLMCVFMSFSLLVGLTLNYFYSLWWLDPAVGVLIAVLLLKEGYTTYKEKELCNC